MQASCEGRLVRIEQPELLEHIFLLTQDRGSQAALLRTSKAWAAVGQRCSPLEVEVGLTDGACWPLGKRRGSVSRVESEKLPSGLPAAAAWLARQRRLVARMELQLDPYWGQRVPAQDSKHKEEDDRVRDLAAAVLEAAAPSLASLTVRSGYDIQWLPRLEAQTGLSLEFEFEPDDYEDGTGPLDGIATAAPQLCSLHLGAHMHAAEAFLSLGASLPASLTSLSLEGYSAGLGPHLSQLISLSWHPIERHTWVPIPEEAFEGLRQATRLTRLSLIGPRPSSIPAFFDSLACLTGLRSLSFDAANEDDPFTILSRVYYTDDGSYSIVLEELLPEALRDLTALTSLSLAGHDMPVCPYSLAHLPALKRLELSLNTGMKQLPHGPWPALEQLDVDSELIEAALADQPAQPLGAPPASEGEGSADAGPEQPGHALWSLRHLTQLRRGLWRSGMTEAEQEEKKQAIRRLLPQLQRLE